MMMQLRQEQKIIASIMDLLCRRCKNVKSAASRRSKVEQVRRGYDSGHGGTNEKLQKLPDGPRGTKHELH